MSFRFGTVGSRRRGGCVGLILAFVFCVTSLIIGLIFILPGVQARLSGVKTQGIVKDIQDCPEDSGGDVVVRSTPLLEIVDNVQPIVQFTDRQGHTYEVQDVICGSYGIGEVVTVWYLPDHPTTWALEKDTPTLFGFAIGLGAVEVISLLVLLGYFGRFLFLAVVTARAAGQKNAPVYSPASYNPAYYPAPTGGGQFASAHMGGVNHQMGETVSIAGGWAVTFTSASPSQGAGFVQAQPGRFFLLAQLMIRNTSNEPLNVSQSTCRLFDAAGVEYQRARAMESPAPGFIQPGEQTEMMLAYDVPGTLRQFRLSFYLSTSSLAQASWDFRV